MKQPIAYLRKSSNGGPRSVSHEAQEAAVRALALADGHEDLTLLGDWAVSGGGTRGRPQYLDMVERIKRGEVSTVYSFAYSRLSRSLADFATLLDLCSKHKVRIVTHQEGVTDLSSATGRAFASMAGVMAQLERELTGERVKAAHQVRRERGDHIGIAPYGWRIEGSTLVPDDSEPLGPILEAYDRAGSAFGAAKILNEQGSRTRRGALWSSKVVSDVLRRQGRLRPGIRTPGAKQEGSWLFFRLLRCPCGHTLTGMDRRGPRYVCYKGRHTPGHPSPYSISERTLLPLIRAEADHLVTPDVVEAMTTDRQDRARLEAERERVHDMYQAGALTRSQWQSRIEGLDVRVAALEATRELVAVPAIDWDDTPRGVNKVLRAIFTEIRLGEDMLPVEYVWRAPRMRRP